jgi:hypothetical protein
MGLRFRYMNEIVITGLTTERRRGFFKEVWQLGNAKAAAKNASRRATAAFSSSGARITG